MAQKRRRVPPVQPPVCRAVSIRYVAMRNCYCLLALVLAAAAMGCGPSRRQAEIERGRQALCAALDRWKSREALDALKALPDPVEFSEELCRTHGLLDYTLGKVDAADAQVIRYTVVLKLVNTRGQRLEREAVYAVLPNTPIVIARDPYF